ncbi:MAG: amino acid adenylation domain-containing protein [Marinifilaceae bacterium]
MIKIDKRNVKTILPLTYLQKSIWVNSIGKKNSGNYIEQTWLKLKGSIDEDMFRTSWQTIIDKYDVLRTVFRWRGLKEPIQIIQRSVVPEIIFQDYSGCANKNEKYAELLDQIRKEELELEKVLFKIFIIEENKSNVTLIIAHHHILFDGWSLGIILKDFFENYQCLVNNLSVPHALQDRYIQNIKAVKDDCCKANEEYWVNYLTGLSGNESMETRLRLKSRKISYCDFTIDPSLVRLIEAFALQQKMTKNTIFSAAWGVLLQILNGTLDYVFYNTVSVRDHIGRNTDDAVGLFINTVPQRIITKEQQTFTDLISCVQKDLIDRNGCLNMDMGRLFQSFDIRIPNYDFSSLLVFENYPIESVVPGQKRNQESGDLFFEDPEDSSIQEGDGSLRSGLMLSDYQFYSSSQFDLTLIVADFDEFQHKLFYDEKIIDSQTLNQIIAKYKQLLKSIVTKPNQLVSLHFDEQLRLLLKNRIENHLVSVGGGDVQIYDFVTSKLIELWAEVFDLEIGTVSIEVNYFDYFNFSLKTVHLVNRIQQIFDVEFAVTEVLESPTIGQLVEVINKKQFSQKKHKLTFAETKEHYILSHEQLRLYYMQMQEEKSILFNSPKLFAINKKLSDKDVRYLQSIVHRLLRQHSSLRTVFREINGEVRQVVLPYHECQLKVEIVHVDSMVESDLFRQDTKKQGATISDEKIRLLYEHYITPFDLSRFPLLRIWILRLRDESNFLLVDIHHIISDGVSMYILMDEIKRLIDSYPLNSVKYYYSDYAHWQCRQLYSDQLSAEVDYWNRIFSKSYTPLELPYDLKGNTFGEAKGAKLYWYYDTNRYQKLRCVLQNGNLTLYSFLLAACYLLFYKQLNRYDIMIGMVVSKRNNKQFEKLVGLLIDSYPIRINLEQGANVGDLLGIVKKRFEEAWKNRLLPYHEIVKIAAGNDHALKKTLFNVMLNLHDYVESDFSVDDVSIKEVDFYYEVPKTDISFDVRRSGEELKVGVEYNTLLFKEETILDFGNEFMLALDQLVDVFENDMFHQELRIFQKNESLPLNTFCDLTCELEEIELQFFDEFRKQVVQNSNKVALVFQDQFYTYKQLDDDSNRIANYLCDIQSSSNSLVGLLLEKNVHRLIAILGVQKSGAAFLPLDVKMPMKRLNYILKDSKVTLVIKDIESELQFQGEFLDYDNLLSCSDNTSVYPLRKPNELAYVIYTSGSTGQPKGVMVENKNLNNYIAAFEEEFKISSGDRVLQQASYVFDTYIEEVFPILSVGGELILISENNKREISYLSSYIQRNLITIVDCSPLMMGQLNGVPDINQLSSVRLFISGGDVLKSAQVDRLHQLGAVYNTYGPTESTVCATYYRCENFEEENQPIGKAIKNYAVSISNFSQFDNFSSPGEIEVVGYGVTRGYLNNPELSYEKYLQVGENREIRKYKTGDIGRFKKDGNIEFIGRIDEQVKIRGFRVDLTEIENTLSTYHKILDVVIICQEEYDGRRTLSAYIVKKNGATLKVSEMRAFLCKHLPEYMLPHLYYEVDTIPLTNGDKPDREALKECGKIVGDDIDCGDCTLTELSLQKIWQSLLKHSNFSIYSHFFEIGGDSILITKAITRIKSKFGVDVLYKDFYNQPTIQAIAKIIDHSEIRDSEVKLKKAEYTDEAPLSFSQERIWFLQQLHQTNKSYNVTRALSFKGQLHLDIFQHAIDLIVEKHEIYRTVFRKRNNSVYQKILPGIDSRIIFKSIDEIDLEQDLNQWVVEVGREVFDLENGPLIRFYLVQKAPTEYFFLVVEHHLIHDGWTQGLLLEEFINIYRNLLENEAYQVPKAKLQYADFSIWQKEYFSKAVLDKHQSFWKEKFRNIPPDLELPCDKPRSSFFDGKGELIVVDIPFAMEERIKKYAAAHDTTLFVIMLTAFKILLYRYSQMNQICVGTGVANRMDEDLEDVLGMVINTMPILTQVGSEGVTIQEFVEQVKESYLDSFQYANTPFEKIVEAVKPERDIRKMPLFQVLFSFMDTPTKRFELPDVDIRIEDSHNQTTKFDINIVIVPTHADNEKVNESMLLEWEYNTDLFHRQTIVEMVDNYYQLLNVILTSDNIPISECPVHSDSTLRRMLGGTIQCNRQDDYSVIGFFKNQVRKYYDKIALVVGDLQISYGCLDQLSNSFANKLKEHEVEQGSVVAYLLNKDADWIIVTLGILKCGAAYLPLDSTLNLKQVKYILDDSKAQLIITKEPFEGGGAFSNNCLYQELFSRTLCLNYEEVDVDKDTLAYIMYTSGSTGNPKGVMVEHKSIVRLVDHPNYIRLDAKVRLLQTGAQAFDASVLEIWGTLLNGGTLFLMRDKEIIDTKALEIALESNCINTMWLTSPLFDQHCEVDVEVFSPLSQLVVGGDVLNTNKVNLFRQIHPETILINGYGPTENTVFTTCHRIEPIVDWSVPIGVPVDGTSVFVVDKNLQLSPQGAKGELLALGDGLARGYLNNPELTDEKFVKISFKDNERGYRTGDIVRWRSDNTLEFFGREDNQVKIRGNRVEIGSIEAQINTHPQVSSVVVVVSENNSTKSLTAYVMPKAALEASQLREYLMEFLPNYMIPDFFVFVPNMPLNRNGKIDREKLVEEYGYMGKVAGSSGKLNSQEKEIAKIWSDVLTIDFDLINKDSNFFDLGGHSINAVKLISKLRDHFRCDMNVVDIFKYTNLKDFSDFLSKKELGREVLKIDKAKELDYYPLSSPQKRLYMLLQLYNDSVVYNISKVVQLNDSVDVQKLNYIFNSLIQQHESLRTSFHLLDGEVKQKIHSTFSFRITERKIDEINYLDEIRKAIKPFDLTQHPLIRVTLFRVGEKRNILLIDLPHIVIDGVSVNKLVEQFALLFKGKQLPAAKYQYRDYLNWSTKWRASEEFLSHEKFWKSVFSTPVPNLSLPTDFTKGIEISSKGQNVYFTIDHSTMKQIRNELLKNDHTMFMFLLFNFFILIQKYSESNDITIGCPISGRSKHEFFDVVGIFANMLPIRFSLDSDLEIEMVFKQFSDRVVQYYSHQNYQFDDIVKNYIHSSNKLDNPLFDVVFAYINNENQEDVLKQMNLKPLSFEKGTTPYQLLLNVFEYDKKIDLVFEYSTESFIDSTVQEMLENYVFIIEQVVRNPKCNLSDIELKFLGEKVCNKMDESDSMDFRL